MMCWRLCLAADAVVTIIAGGQVHTLEIVTHAEDYLVDDSFGRKKIVSFVTHYPMG